MPFKLEMGERYIGEEFRNETIDHDTIEEERFEKLLECFDYMSEEKGGIAEFYTKKKQQNKRFTADSLHKKKGTSF